MKFLEVVTRTYKRPQMLHQCTLSLQLQTSPNWQQTLLIDDVGRGVGWANAQLATFTPSGQWIWVLDDDDICNSATLVADLQYAAWLNNAPPAFILRMDHGPLGILPDDAHWAQPPHEGGIGASGIVTRRDVWLRCCGAWASGRYASDYDFIAAVWAAYGPEIVWYDCVASAVQRISRGEPELI